MSNADIFSLHLFFSEKEIPFDPAEYSRFKYGSKSVARKFGKELGVGLGRFLTKDPQRSISDVVVLPSPYMFIPTATFALKDYTIAALNKFLVERKHDPVMESKVYRQTGYTEDYGQMSIEDRRRVMNAETFHTDKEFLRDKTVIFMDDIRITGAHEERMEEMIERLELGNITNRIVFCYFAQLYRQSTNPTIENYLNYYAVRSLLDLDKIIKNDEFIFNTRNVKYILNAPHVECVNFLEYQRHSFIETLYHNAIGNSYHLEEKFKMNFQYLEYLINK
jgi:hypothetical protein